MQRQHPLQHQPAPEDGLDWRETPGGTVPVSRRFGDPYYSLDDGLAETRHVFLDGNDLPARLRDGFHVAELGFGTGLNLCVLWAAWEAWRAAGGAGALRFTSFEAHPLDRDAMARALAAFPALCAQADRLIAGVTPGDDAAWSPAPGLTVQVIHGQAAATLPGWEGRVDAWFLDGFAPARNPDMWSDDLMGAVARHTAAGGTLATYTAAGHVRRALGAAGFTVTRLPGYGRKRHMTRAVLQAAP